jgi:predicted acylesterase/phospholipase RssA
MARRSRGKRVFILGGGASLGAHQVGVIKYLEEQGIRPDAIVGSSIGVINACLYASGGPELMERAWSAFRTGVKVFRPSLRHNPVAGLSLFSMDPLAEAVEEHLDFAKIHASPLELSFILLNLSRGEGQFVSNQGARSPAELRKFARAGYAMPPIFPPVRIRGEWFVDGGFAWNVPILQAVEMGATEIFVLAVIAPQLPFKRNFRGFPDYLARLTDVMWRTLGNVGYVTTRIESDGTYRGVPVTVIHPTEELAGFSVANLLRASPRRNRQLITAGYRDAKRELARRARARKRAAEPSSTPVEVAPAYRHEVA